MPLGAIGLSVVLWSAAYVISGWALETGSPAVLSVGRFAIALIVLVAFTGTINASGGDLGVLVPLEHAVLAHNATDARRTQVFARYSLIGALCTAVGSLAASLPDFLVASGSTRPAPPPGGVRQTVLSVCCSE